MTVKELIEELKKHPEDTEVNLEDNEYGYVEVTKVVIIDNEIFVDGQYSVSGKVVVIKQ